MPMPTSKVPNLKYFGKPRAIEVEVANACVKQGLTGTWALHQILERYLVVYNWDDHFKGA